MVVPFVVCCAVWLVGWAVSLGALGAVVMCCWCVWCVQVFVIGLVPCLCPMVSSLVAVVVSFVVAAVSVSLPIRAVPVWTVALVLLSGV